MWVWSDYAHGMWSLEDQLDDDTLLAEENFVDAFSFMQGVHGICAAPILEEARTRRLSHGACGITPVDDNLFTVPEPQDDITAPALCNVHRA